MRRGPPGPAPQREIERPRRGAEVAARFAGVRRASLALAAPLSAEDAMVQSMPDASPAKWHLAHTTWFFETFVLAAAEPDARPFDPAYRFLFNSYYEADAYARWAGARLPTEEEWELAARGAPVRGQFVEDGALVPTGEDGPLGGAWVWTASPYVGYPGFRPVHGALGEYNGKFMVNQLVLRGGSCFSPRSHLRATYRNFFPPSARWQMTGIRLAR